MKSGWTWTGFTSVMALAALTVGASPATAQTAGASETGDGIADIVVTARRRDESLQTTPVAVTVVNDAALRDKSVVNISDVGRLVPNLTISSGRGSASAGFIFIRGIGQADDAVSKDPGVAQYVDDVYLGRIQGALLNVLDLGSIEVLRGPQGTLYGKNTIGGAIKISSKLPGPDQQIEGLLSYGNYRAVNAGLAVNQPITDTLFVRASATYVGNRGTMKNLFDGTRLSDADNLAGRFLMRFTPADDLELLLSVDASRDRAGPAPGYTAEVDDSGPINALVNALIGPMNDYLRTRRNQFTGSYDGYTSQALAAFRPRTDTFGASLRVTRGDERFQIKSITAYRSLDQYRIADADSSPFAVAQFGDRTDQWQFSQELQLSGEALDGRLNWLGGLYYFHEKVDVLQLTEFIPAFAQLALPEFGIAPGDLDISQRKSTGLKTNSYAAFANATFAVTDRLSATAGLRYTSEKKAIDIVVNRVTDGAVLLAPPAASDRFSDVSPKIEIDYKWSPQLFTYVSASKGFKSGGFNEDVDPNGTLPSFEPETVWTYEAGVKFQSPDRRMRVYLTGFYSDYRDLQLQTYTVAGGNFFQLTDNAGAATIKGLELELSFRPIPMLTLYGNGAYTDARYDDYVYAGQDVSSRKLVFTPKYSLLAGVTLEPHFGNGQSALFDVNYSYRSKVYFDTQNTESLSQSGFGLLNARMAYRFRDGAIEMALFGRNITDKRTIINGVSLLDSFGVAMATPGNPRTYGAELRFRF